MSSCSHSADSCQHSPSMWTSTSAANIVIRLNRSKVTVLGLEVKHKGRRGGEKRTRWESSLLLLNMKQLLHIYILRQALHPHSTLTVTPSWLTFALSNPSNSSKTVLPTKTWTSPKFSLLTPLPCSLLWLKVYDPETKGTPPKHADQVSLPLQHCMLLAANSSCATQPGLKCPPSWFPSVGLNFPPTSGLNGHSSDSFCNLS